MNRARSPRHPHGAAIAAVVALAAACAVPPPVAVEGDGLTEVHYSGAQARDLFLNEDGVAVAPALPVLPGATRVAIWWSTLNGAPAAATPSLRVVNAAGATSAWQAADVRFIDAHQGVARVDLGTATAAVAVEIGFAPQALAALAHVTLGASVPTPRALPESVHLQGVHVQRSQALVAGVEPRSAWGARDPNACSEDVAKDHLSVHHAVMPLLLDGSYADHADAIHGIQAYHMDGHGWCDIGYHYAVTSDGSVWEAREEHYLGAHAGGANTANIGVVFVGCFDPSESCDGLGDNIPPETMLDAGGTLIGRLAAQHGFPVDGTTVIGHRDNPGQTTTCPGDNLHALLPEVRAVAAEAAGDPATPTGTLQGVVFDLGITSDASASSDLGARLPSAAVHISGTNLPAPVEVALNADAFFSIDLAPGTYRVEAAADGYAPTGRTAAVGAGASVWSSVALAPNARAVHVIVTVNDARTGHAVARAEVTADSLAPIATDAFGRAALTLVDGAVHINAHAAGYAPASTTRTLVAGADAAVTLSLEPEDDANQDDDAVRITPPPPFGCASAAAPGDALLPALAAAWCASAIRRRRSATYRGAALSSMRS